MPYSFTATRDFFNAQKRVKTLIVFAEQECQRNREDNRNLFLKLGVVLLVTRFQVYIESILSEFNYEVKNAGKPNSNISLHLRLSALKILIDSKSLSRELENVSSYGIDKFEMVKGSLATLNDLCIDENLIHSDFKINTQFPLGKQGLNEVRSLFKQLNGKDIFERVRFDVNKLNEILHRRHNIIHQDANMQLTEVTLTEYKNFMSKVVRHIDRYLSRYLPRP